jgi:hypothetical protein
MTKTTTERAAIAAAYEAQGAEVLTGKGGFFVRGRGFRTLAQARTDTGINMSQPRIRRDRIVYGDYAWMLAISNAKIGQ